MGGAPARLAALSGIRPAHRTRRPPSTRSCRRSQGRRIHHLQASLLSARIARRRNMGAFFAGLS